MGNKYWAEGINIDSSKYEMQNKYWLISICSPEEQMLILGYVTYLVDFFYFVLIHNVKRFKLVK